MTRAECQEQERRVKTYCLLEAQKVQLENAIKACKDWPLRSEIDLQEIKFSMGHSNECRLILNESGLIGDDLAGPLASLLETKLQKVKNKMETL